MTGCTETTFAAGAVVSGVALGIKGVTARLDTEISWIEPLCFVDRVLILILLFLCLNIDRHFEGRRLGSPSRPSSRIRSD